MARFFGRVQGRRGPATRLGHATSGLDVVAMSYQGDVEVRMFAVGEADHVGIYVREHGYRGHGKCIYTGPVGDLLEQSARKTMLQSLANDTLINPIAVE